MDGDLLRAVIEPLRRVLEREPRVAYAFVFGSTARGRASAHADVDVAIGLAGGHRPALLELGALAARLEAAASRPVDLVLLDEAPPVLAYQVFRDGMPLIVRDPRAAARRRARAILDYLDFRPIVELCARGVLAARHGR